VNALVLQMVERLGKKRLAAAGLAAGALAVVLLPAVIPIPAANGRPVDVAVVQGNDLEQRLSNARAEDLLIARTHARLHRTLSTHPPDLAVWPENAFDVDPTRDPAYRSIAQRAIRAVGVPTLVGAITDGPRGKEFNETRLYGGRGWVVGRYAKVHLVPFGEYVPWRNVLGWLPALHELPHDLSPGGRLHLLHVGDLRFAVVICFENAFPSLDRRIIAKGAGFLVVSTNDASYGRTAASRQHLIMSRFRAVENGRWVVHAAISGISAFIDPHGHVFEPTDLFRATVDRHVIRTSTARTIYGRFGDYLPLASMALVAALMLAPRGRRRRREPAALPPTVRTLVVLPTYNERQTIGQAVSRTLASAPEADILVVDDASPDGTADIVRELARSEPRVRLLERGGKGGLAGAYMTGFRLAMQEGYQLVTEMDADLSHQPEELPALLEGARRFDLVIGSRYVPGGSVTNWGLLRRMLSRAGNAYARVVLGLPVADSTSGYRVFRRELLAFLLRQGIHSEGYAFQVELAYRAWRAGFAVGEVPITFREREHGHSKISRRIVFEALWQVASWGLRDRLHIPVAQDADGAPGPRGGSRDAPPPGSTVEPEERPMAPTP